MPLLSIHPKKLKALTQIDVCTPVFTVALLLVKRWKQLCPRTDEWLKQNVECYSAIQMNELFISTATWMDFENTLLNEISQTQKDKYHMTSLIWYTKHRQIHRHRK